MATRRKARGYWGGQTAKQLGGLNVEITVPVIEGLDLDEDTLNKKVGQALAASIRKTLGAGRQPDGSALPVPQPRRKTEPAGRPLHRTGKLIADIRYRDGVVSPSTSIRPELRARARSNFGLLKILVSGVFHRKGRPEGAVSRARGPIDPLGALDPALPAKVNALAQKYMARVIKLRGRGEPLR